MSKIDDIDKEILEILQDNCRISYSKIAKKLGVAESTVRYRVARLRREGVITNFIALLDPRKIGLEITAIVLIKVDAQHITEVSKKLATFKELHHLFQSTGEYDLVSVVHARNMLHLNDIRRRIKMLRGVREASVFVATQLIKVEPKFDLRI
ncbi:TPA: Lrp/AsnC family transcriptional regulator [Candidatus Bathyarchaeota archaeon]|nr:Lrp/AsnC family transcriptional regulator [Candidatus Bathyarchaeota archaeon]